MDEKRIIAIVGDGGVGKTTISFLLGVRFWEDGKDIGLISIDPTKRY